MGTAYKPSYFSGAKAQFIQQKGQKFTAHDGVLARGADLGSYYFVSCNVLPL